MTFSLLGRCARTARIGAVVSTSSMAVGCRVPFVAAKTGGVLAQALADPRLGLRGLELMRSGCSAAETMAALVASSPQSRWRQLAVLDATGRSAVHHGEELKPAYAAAQEKNVVAIGNYLASEAVPSAMCDAFRASPDDEIAARLIRALKAGEEAGGQNSQVSSAAILIFDQESFPLVDLRVDQAERPIEELWRLWESYRPAMEEFVIRACDPERAKSSTWVEVERKGSVA